MATNSGAATDEDPRSGAEMVPLRRPMSPTTPSDRPGFLNSTLRSTHWISRRVLPPTRSIIGGASRMLASVIGLESSSSSSSSERDSSSDDTDDNNDYQDVSSQGVHAIEDHVHILDTSDDYNYLRGFLSCYFVGHQREPKSFAGKNENKCLIEQLLMQESFSRQEFDKLTDIIKSRVVDSPAIGGLGIGRLNEMPERTDVENHDFCNIAVMEATKLLEEKSGSNSKSEMHYGTSALNSVTLKHDVEGEAGSLLDMAKSYRTTRPPRESPSKNNIDYISPSLIAMPLFKGKTPYSIGGNIKYSSKRKRYSPATGSWNIHDEIRKVRSKATEEMLRTLSSSNFDRPSFPLELKSGPDSMVGGNLGPAKEDKSPNSKTPVDAFRDMAAKPVPQLTQDAFHDDALPRSATIGCEEIQVMQATQSIERKKDETLNVGMRLQSTVDMKPAVHSDVVAHDANRLKEPNRISSIREGTAQDSQVEDKNCWTLIEVAGIGNINGFPSGSNISCKLEKEEDHRPIFSNEGEAVGCGHDNTVKVVTEAKIELLCETSMEVPVVNQTDAAASGSQQSWSMLYEGKNDSGLENQQQGKEMRRYYTRNRARNR